MPACSVFADLDGAVKWAGADGGDVSSLGRGWLEARAWFKAKRVA